MKITLGFLNKTISITSAMPCMEHALQAGLNGCAICIFPQASCGRQAVITAIKKAVIDDRQDVLYRDGMRLYCNQHGI